MKGKTIKPGKQRKRLFQAAYHARGKILSAHLSADLRKNYNTRSLPVRRGDTVRVLRGDYKGVEGKIVRVDRKKYRIFIEGITRQKSDGTTIFVPIHPSKVEIIRLNLDDKFRKRILERRLFIEEPKKLEEPISEG
ncbi:MAG: 50S ribosomal protein L24 [Candidatus Bathyarchaeota archaeon]|nr:50S ribosomal protein L24 [Candidatus Bathyarchaeota archaeon]